MWTSNRTVCYLPCLIQILYYGELTNIMSKYSYSRNTRTHNQTRLITLISPSDIVQGCKNIVKSGSAIIIY